MPRWLPHFPLRIQRPHVVLAGLTLRYLRWHVWLMDWQEVPKTERSRDGGGVMRSEGEGYLQLTGSFGGQRWRGGARRGCSKASPQPSHQLLVPLL